MARIKTKKTKASIEKFINSILDAKKREDSLKFLR
jgi:hypothetical protein